MPGLNSKSGMCHGFPMSHLFRVSAIFFGLVIFVSPLWGGGPETPKPGSTDRTAICDAMRNYVRKDAVRPLPKPLLFKVEFIRVDGAYAGFEGFPVFEDGTAAIPNFMPDIVYTTFLKRKGTGWQVIADLSRTDVPANNELISIRKSFPPGIPSTVLPEFWRKKLRP